jgi:hypothetical protein
MLRVLRGVIGLTICATAGFQETRIFCPKSTKKAGNQAAFSFTIWSTSA